MEPLIIALHILVSIAIVALILYALLLAGLYFLIQTLHP